MGYELSYSLKYPILRYISDFEQSCFFTYQRNFFFLETLLKFAQGDIEFTQILIAISGKPLVLGMVKKDTPLFESR